jgi:hypothetical protein
VLSTSSQGVNGSGNLATNTWSRENKTNGMTIDSDINHNVTGLAGGSGALMINFHF